MSDGPAALLVLALAACTTPAAPSPAAVPAAPPAGSDADRRELEEVRNRIALPDLAPESLGRLHEQEGEALARLGRTEEAATAFDKAASAYSHSAAGTGMPAINSARAAQRAADLRAGRVRPP